MPTWTRREFVRATAAVSATAAMSPRGVRGANDRIGVALIGAGSRGTQLWPQFLQQPDDRAVEVRDNYEPFRRRAAEAVGKPVAVEKDSRRVLDRGWAPPPTSPSIRSAASATSAGSGAIPAGR
jgi:hypothetical protein